MLTIRAPVVGENVAIEPTSRTLTTLSIVVPTVATAVTRNRDCDATKLAGQTPPYGGQLVPKETVLVERAGWFQLSKLVDVYDGANANATRVGYFFDMNFLLWMRFGYADASDRVWFEGRYSGFFARFLPYLSLSLVRCDHAEAPCRSACPSLAHAELARRPRGDTAP